jgi:hypothetical protein
MGFAIAYADTETIEAKQDGLSLETAVIINVEQKSYIPAAEWDWIEKHLPGAKRLTAKPKTRTEDGDETITFAHSLHKVDGKIYSVLLVELPNGSEREVYFDITSSFGK